MRKFQFNQVDVFTATPLKGNPLAVVLGADDLDEADMAAFARWTNLSETTFLLQPTLAGADYRVRIFTPGGELPFAGHPTLGSCHVWLAAGGVPAGTEIVQECGAGPVRIRRDGARLAFAAPPLLRDGPVDPGLLAAIAGALGVPSAAILGASHADNGPGWVAVMIGSRAEVLALRPDMARLADLPKIGVVAPILPGEDGIDAQFEVRAFAPGVGVNEDPVTGSLNAGLAQWLIGTGRAPASYVVSQGTVLGRAGRVHVAQAGADIWIGGETVTCIEGSVRL